MRSNPPRTIDAALDIAKYYETICNDYPGNNSSINEHKRYFDDKEITITNEIKNKNFFRDKTTNFRNFQKNNKNNRFPNCAYGNRKIYNNEKNSLPGPDYFSENPNFIHNENSSDNNINHPNEFKNYGTECYENRNLVHRVYTIKKNTANVDVNKIKFFDDSLIYRKI